MAAMHEEHHVPAACPACGGDLLEPDRYDDSRAYVCDLCGVHILWSDGHVRLSWDHRPFRVGEPHDRPHRVGPRGVGATGP